jgi:hypothetical protein
MKKMVGLWGILFLCVALPLLADSGPSAHGNFDFAAASGPLEFKFNVKMKNNHPDGELTVHGSVDLPDQDVDGEGSGSGAGVAALSITVDVHCFVVNGNRATMSGEVTGSNIGSYLGRTAILAVEDNGEGSKDPPDRFTWGFYGTPALTWVPTDAELEFDEGAGLFWVATDAEREDDAGISSHPSTTVDCHTFPASAYALESLPHGSGNIQVKP